MNNLNETTLIEETPMTSRPNSLRTLRRTRTRVLLGIAAVLSAVLVSGATRPDQGSMEVGSAAMADSVSSAATDVTPPARDARVFHQSMPLYHWHTACPLADARTRRPGKPSTPAKRSFMSRTQAEKRELLPCVYCADLD